MGSRKGFPYQRGFGNEFQTEAVPGALPLGQNNPQACPHGLYAEQLSGTAFTVPRKSNQRTWLYRTLPSVVHGEYERVPEERAPGLWARGRIVTPERLRWRPRALPSVPTGQGAVDFVRGLLRVGESGSAAARDGLSVYSYVCNQSMRQCALYSADGDWLIVPQQGMLLLQTELGYVHAGPCECVVVPRGIRFRVSIQGDEDTAEPVMARGFVLEVYHGHWELPDLGVIGANGCAAPRDFEYPVAAYDAPSSGETAAFTVFAKFNNELFAYRQPHSPFNVVAWHGNYAPCRYDLRRFCPVNAEQRGRGGAGGFRGVSAALACAGAHVPPAVFSPQLHDRVYDEFVWRIRCQTGVGICARRLLAALDDECTRAGRGVVRAGGRRRADAATRERREHGGHVRDQPYAAADAAGAARPLSRPAVHFVLAGISMSVRGGANREGVAEAERVKEGSGERTRRQACGGV
eukprot:ctg_627.g308